MEVYQGIMLGDVVSFSVLSGVKAVIPTKFENVKVVSLLDADSAKTLIDPYSLHRNIFPVLPQGTCPDDPTQYYYLKVKLSNGRYTAIGTPWIDSATMEKRDSGTAQLKVDMVSASDLPRLKDLLSAGGFRLVEAKMI